jgi:hypothetical protein
VSKQGKTLGLKSNAIALAKTQAAGQLAPYDWYVTRKSEKSTAIPSAVSTYRDAVRTACAAIETSIANASDLAAFMALYDTPVDQMMATRLAMRRLTTGLMLYKKIENYHGAYFNSAYGCKRRER